VSETELFFRLSEDKLRRRATWAGAALSLSLLMPYEIIDDQPQFLWQLFGELPASAVVAAVAEVVAGLLIIAARYLVRDAVPFAMTVLAAMFGAFICSRIGADASAWGLLPLPRSFAARATLALIAMAGTAAGTSLAYRERSRRASTVFIVGSIVVALLFYSWPGRGRAPAMLIAQHLSVLGDLPGFRFQLGTLTLGVVALWPAIITLSGLYYVRRPPQSASTSLLPIVALFGFPLILMMLLFAWYARTNPGAALFPALGAALEITAVLALTSGAFEMLGQGVLSEVPPMSRRTPESTIKRAARICSGALIALTIGMWWISRPPDKGVRWELGEASPEADELFGERVVKWSRARWNWHVSVQRDSAAKSLENMREQGRALVDAAEPVDAGLAAALAEMIATGERLDASSRGWYRAVAHVNAASRDARLPYYLDPEVSIRKSSDGLIRQFAAHTYRVVRARRFDVDGEAFSTLHVRRLRKRRGGHRAALLGLSRDVQPFALVVVEANAEHLLELRQLAGDGDRTPRCGRTFEEEGDAILARCGSLLVDVLAEPTVNEAVTAKVERHELQHQIDGPLLPMATSVLEKLGGYADAAQERVNRELSAYLAQLTSQQSPVHVGLVVPLRFVLLHNRGTYHHAAVLMFEALGGRRIRDARGRIQTSLLAPVFEELVALSEQALRERAADAWERLFDDELPPVVFLDEQHSPQ
jgi:hypothetical protein